MDAMSFRFASACAIAAMDPSPFSPALIAQFEHKSRQKKIGSADVEDLGTAAAKSKYALSILRPTSHRLN
jgi:hypothetical protein